MNKLLRRLMKRFDREGAYSAYDAASAVLQKCATDYQGKIYVTLELSEYISIIRTSTKYEGVFK